MTSSKTEKKKVYTDTICTSLEINGDILMYQNKIAELVKLIYPKSDEVMDHKVLSLTITAVAVVELKGKPLSEFKKEDT